MDGGVGIVELLARIGLAWTRTFYFVMEGAFGDVALWDVGIIAATVVVGLVHHTASATVKGGAKWGQMAA